MRAISIWQPYAQLIAMGVKRFETRSWATVYRGPIAIHAAAHGQRGFSRDEYAHMERLKLWPQVQMALQTPMVFGAVICICDLTHCWGTSDALRAHISAQEMVLGDFSNNRLAWELTVIEVFDEPYPCKGDKGLWEWKRP